MLTVTYNLNSGWTMSQAHVYVGVNPPNPNGAPGQFPFKKSFSPAVSTYTFTVPLGFLGEIEDCGQVVYIATHATVKQGSKTDTAWGGHWNNGAPHYDFNWANKWGGYFSLTLLPNPSLPAGQVWYNATHYGNKSYWGVNFENSLSHPFPPGAWAVSPAGNQWVGWCADKQHFMYANWSYKTTLANACSSPLPPVALNPNWDKVNYLVTQRNDGLGIYALDWSNNANKDAFEQAIWFYSDGITPNIPLAQQFVADAEANGDNFVPGEDDNFVVILVPDTASNDQKFRAQMNIIELKCAHEY
jgi:hypothetical protein